jgi:hypothetical protein
MVDYESLVILSNTIIMAATLLATLYRIRIERKQVCLTEQNLEYKKRIEVFKIMLDKEKDEIMKMTSEEIYEMLEKVWKDE